MSSTYLETVGLNSGISDYNADLNLIGVLDCYIFAENANPAPPPPNA